MGGNYSATMLTETRQEDRMLLRTAETFRQSRETVLPSFCCVKENAVFLPGFCQHCS